MLVVLSILIIHAIAKGLQDRIRFKGLFFDKPIDDWINGLGKYRWDKRTFWTKYPFSFLSDGWHLMDAIRVMSLCILVTILLGLPIWYIIVFYIIHGIIFEITYNIKL